MARSYGGRSLEDRRAERRERLLVAGLELFGARGFAGTPIETLCSAAGVSTRTFYEEFASREDLLVALHVRFLTRAMDAVVTALAEADGAPWTQRIEVAVTAFLRSSAGDPRWARLAFVEVVGVSPAVEEHRLRWRQQWVDFIVTEAERAVAGGEARARPFRLGALALVAAVNELGHDWSRHGGDEAAVVAELVRIGTCLIDPV